MIIIIYIYAYRIYSIDILQKGWKIPITVIEYIEIII